MPPPERPMITPIPHLPIITPKPRTVILHKLSEFEKEIALQMFLLRAQEKYNAQTLEYLETKVVRPHLGLFDYEKKELIQLLGQAGSKSRAFLTQVYAGKFVDHKTGHERKLKTTQDYFDAIASYDAIFEWIIHRIKSYGGDLLACEGCEKAQDKIKRVKVAKARLESQPLSL